MRDLGLLLSMPWTIERSERHDDGDYFVLRIRELPGFVAASNDPAELEQIFWDALQDHLASYLEDGEMPPLPEEARLTIEAMGREIEKQSYSKPAAETRTSSAGLAAQPSRQLQGVG